MAIADKRKPLLDHITDASTLATFDDLVLCDADMFVTQIAGNPKVEKWPEAQYETDTKYLGFMGYAADQWDSISLDDLTMHLRALQVCFFY